jgi:PAS domain-containing protein
MIPTLPPLADVLDLMPDAVCVVDVDGHFLFGNASFQRILGYTPDDVPGRPVFDLVHPDDRVVTARQAEAVMAGELRLRFRNRHVHKAVADSLRAPCSAFQPARRHVSVGRQHRRRLFPCRWRRSGEARRQAASIVSRPGGISAATPP